jgi:hypothetical protein
LVRGSSRCDDIRPIKEGYGSAGKGANDDHDLAGNAGGRPLRSYSVARSQRVRVRQRRSPAFQRGLKVALSGLQRDHLDPCSLSSISANRTYPTCMGYAYSSRRCLRGRAGCIWTRNCSAFLKASNSGHTDDCVGAGTPRALLSCDHRQRPPILAIQLQEIGAPNAEVLLAIVAGVEYAEVGEPSSLRATTSAS